MQQPDNEQLDLCLRVLGVAATRLDTLEQSGTSLDADKVPPVTVQYLMLRIHLVCCINDEAETLLTSR